MSIYVDGKNVDDNIFTGLKIKTELDIQASKILVSIINDGGEWCMEYPAKGIDKNAGRFFGDINHDEIKVDRSKIEEPIGKDFINHLVGKTTKKEDRIFNQEEKKKLFNEIEVYLMDIVDNVFETVEDEEF